MAGSIWEPEYRIHKSQHDSYFVLIRRWWWPFWVTVGGQSPVGFHERADAETFAQTHAQGEGAESEDYTRSALSFGLPFERARLEIVRAEVAKEIPHFVREAYTEGFAAGMAAKCYSSRFGEESSPSASEALLESKVWASLRRKGLINS